MPNNIDTIIKNAIIPEAYEITDAFYVGMMSNNDAALFLSSDLVNERLHTSMQNWLIELFTPRSDDEEQKFSERQAEIGLVHARINVPMHLVTKGMGIIKRECSKRLDRADLDRKQILEALVRVNEVLDDAVNKINISYLTHAMEIERNDQSFRLHAISHNLAIECERLRSRLFDWLRKALIEIYRNDRTDRLDVATKKIASSEVGLWIDHKAELLFPGLEHIKKLKVQVESIDQYLDYALQERKQGITDKFKNIVSELDNAVSETAWLLSSLVEHVLEEERARDPLTHVLSRRYLESIMQREVKLSIQSDKPFGVLLIDVDKFKKLNDTYGHTTGDMVLNNIGDILLSCVRANDYVFRYGGEEFLILLGGTTEKSALEVAEKIRSAIGTHYFTTFDDQKITITASIGVAVHEGHPDYRYVLERADAALYEAKKAGRNRCVLAN